MPDDMLELARAAYSRNEWRDALRQFASAGDHELSPADLECAAKSAELTGHTQEADTWWTRAVHEYERKGDNERAARCGWWLGMSFMQRGDMAQAGGWFARAHRAIGDGAGSAVSGYLLIPEALQSLFGGNAPAARPTFVEVLRLGEQYGDGDLMTFGRLGLGQALLDLGDAAQGMATLDDAMVSVTAGEVSPLVAGIVYCSVIEACHARFDLRRATEWTEALSRWCDDRPDLVRFRGQCLIHRAEIMKVRGAWVDALDELKNACVRLSEPPPQPALAGALYERAEVHRLRGDFAEAEEAYRETSQWGREPQPGLALLRLAQGQLATAEAAIRRVVGETRDLNERARSLIAFVDIMVAVDDIATARLAAAELATIAEAIDAPYLGAAAEYATGSVALADGDAQSAIGALRRAWALWCDLDTPYDAARARVLIALACRDLGDQDTSTLELDIARVAFTQMGAAPDLARLDALRAPVARPSVSGLTGREIEVLELVATGKTNRQIAEALFISEKTVARHVSNIFTKLAVNSRAAATAHAYRHGLA